MALTYETRVSRQICSFHVVDVPILEAVNVFNVSALIDADLHPYHHAFNGSGDYYSNRIITKCDPQQLSYQLVHGPASSHTATSRCRQACFMPCRSLNSTGWLISGSDHGYSMAMPMAYYGDEYEHEHVWWKPGWVTGCRSSTVSFSAQLELATDRCPRFRWRCVCSTDPTDEIVHGPPKLSQYAGSQDGYQIFLSILSCKLLIIV